MMNINNMNNNKKKERVQPTVVSKFCLGTCDREIKYTEDGKPYMKCWSCGRELGKD